MEGDESMPGRTAKVKRSLSHLNGKPMTPTQLKVMQEVSGAALAVEPYRPTEQSDDEYDTDIESDENTKPTFDNSGIDTYMKTCRKLRQLPIRQVCHALANSRAIEVKNRGLSAHGVLSITNALLVNVAVTSLCLDGNSLPSKALKYISWLLTENLSINTLSLNDNKFEGDGVLELCGTVKMSATLVKLSLSGNHLDDVHASHIANMLMYNTVLQDLNLSYNNFTDEGAASLADSLAANDYLKIIDLSWNKIRPAGVVQICKAVQENVMLKSLNLSMNGVAGEGCEAVSAMLQNNDSLTHLNLSHCRIKDVDALVLTRALQKNDSLRSLNLSHNTLNSSTIVALLESIKHSESKNLHTFDLSGILIFRCVLFYVHQIKQGRSVFRFNHGDIITYNGAMGEEENQLVSRSEPRELFCWFLSIKKITLESLVEGESSVSKEHMSHLIKRIGLSFSTQQLDQLYQGEDGTQLDSVDLLDLTPRLH